MRDIVSLQARGRCERHSLPYKLEGDVRDIVSLQARGRYERHSLPTS